ncbi:patatin-like phospholipase family protein [Virgibacillus byunsanensis]|uniref:Patatin-like phospholipase family protein n=1 Tax=Virgibacillus byunsanensis TaxID=570945 RepID=A0ABW3LJC7_9BACI
MKIDAVFSGGGIKGFAYIGALQSISENDLEMERVAGTSAGAIIASFLAADYTWDEIRDLFEEMDLKHFLDTSTLNRIIPFSKWLFLYFQLGLYKGDKFENWLYNTLAKKGIISFKDIKKGYLKVVVSDLSLGKLVVIPDDLERVYGIDSAYFPVSRAVRMSAGFPYFFMPKKLLGRSNHKSLIVDGGLLSNFPLWVFNNGGKLRKRPILGIKLTGFQEQYQAREIKNAFQMFHALFSTMMQAHDARYISKSQTNNIIFIPSENVDTINFKITDLVKKELIQTGKHSTDLFLKYWST